MSEPPRKLGRYLLRHKLAEGGMASVYLAQLVAEGGFRKWVALKTIHSHLSSDPAFVEMFLNEARLVARLDHPNICQVFDFGEVDGTSFLAMEYLKGESLLSVLRHAWRQGPLPLAIGAAMVADAARGLHAAHELKRHDGKPVGVVHRDVSPQNIFVLYDGVSKVVDFGIAQYADRAGEKTATGTIKGKLSYMAPEQISASSMDRRVDVFALGVVLWELTLGFRLFKRQTEAETLYAVLEKPIPDPAEHREDYPAELSKIVLRALARNPDERYPTAGEMARDLERFIGSSGEAAGPGPIADFMSQLFADRIAMRDELLGEEPDEDPQIDVDVDAPQSGSARLGTRHQDRHALVRALHEGSPESSEPPITPAAMHQPARKRSQLPWLIGAAALAIVGGVAIGLSVTGSEEEPPSPASVAAPPSEAAAEEPREPAQVAAPPAPEVAPAEPEAPIAAPVDPPSEPVTARETRRPIRPRPRTPHAEAAQPEQGAPTKRTPVLLQTYE